MSSLMSKYYKYINKYVKKKIEHYKLCMKYFSSIRKYKICLVILLIYILNKYSQIFLLNINIGS